MKFTRIVATIAISGLLGGCSMFNPEMWSWNSNYSPTSNNLWLVEADADNGYRDMGISEPGPTMPKQASIDPIRPQMPMRQDVVAGRDMASTDASAYRPVAASQEAMNACVTQRAAFGGAEEKRIAFLIQMDIEQARAVAESTNIDAATKAQLLSELSRNVKELSKKSQGIELFRDGVYALCQAHASGALTPAAYSERFDSLIRTANESVQLENANFQFNLGNNPHQPVSMPRR
ncbi:MAG: hypothetical protein H6981_12160 [Gammaproteobacteria bacterium]|nr:hypothetical protein [Gammaproteobacteria bacterium]MCP5137543.1 hypothetical protein [Gammaproteobacteria bacterium]